MPTTLRWMMPSSLLVGLDRAVDLSGTRTPQIATFSVCAVLLVEDGQAQRRAIGVDRLDHDVVVGRVGVDLGEGPEAGLLRRARLTILSWYSCRSVSRSVVRSAIACFGAGAVAFGGGGLAAIADRGGVVGGLLTLVSSKMVW